MVTPAPSRPETPAPSRPETPAPSRPADPEPLPDARTGPSLPVAIQPEPPLSDAPPPLIFPAPPPTVRTSTRRGASVPPGPRKISPAAVIVGFTAVALVVTLVVTQGQRQGPHPTQVLGTQTQRPTSTAQVPVVSDLLGYTLMDAEPGRDLAVVPFSGTRRTVGGFAPAGYPDGPMRTGTAVVTLRGGTAYVLTPPFTGPTAIGPADHIFPAMAPGAVGVWSQETGGGPSTVQIEALPGTRAASSAVMPFPRGGRPIAEMTSGILVGDSQGSAGALRVWRPGADGSTGTFTRTLGVASAVIGTSGDKVAWLAARGCTSNGECPLHVTDAATGVETSVAPPPGFAGYLPGGAFSPIWDQLFAVYVFNPVQHAANARLVLVSLTAATTNRPRWTPALVPDGDVPLMLNGPPLPVVWTPDGTHVLFAGNTGKIHDFRLGQTASYPTEQPASASFTVLGEPAVAPSPSG